MASSTGTLNQSLSDLGVAASLGEFSSLFVVLPVLRPTTGKLGREVHPVVPQDTCPTMVPGTPSVYQVPGTCSHHCTVAFSGTT